MGEWRGWGHGQCVGEWAGSTYLERGRVEGGRDVSHSRWTVAWQVGEQRGQGHGQEGSRDASHGGWTVAWQVDERRGQGHGQEGGQDASHSGWTAAWCLTMSKSRCQVFLFSM